MSIVAPNGQVRLLKNIPLDDKYENTLWFTNKEAQTLYFTAITPVHTMINATRFKDGVIKVNVGEDTIRECNYLMFQNMNFSNKWFYAFIKGTEYVNNDLTYVYYEIDPFQTYIFDVSFLDCLVERETTASDNVGEHTIGENLGAPELKVDRNIANVGFSNNMDAIVFSSSKMEDGEWVTAPIECINGLLCMQEPTIRADQYIRNGEVASASWSVMESVLQSLIEDNKADSIIGGVCMPTEFANTGSLSQGIDKNFAKSGLYTGLDGYTPKNNKMYNSPYCVIRLQMSDGQCVFLQPEYITGSYIAFRQITVCSMTPELAVIPKNYKGQTLAFNEGLSFTAFPQFSIAVDGYKAWVASGGLAQANLSLSQTERQVTLANEEVAMKGLYNTMGNITTGAIGVATKDVEMTAKGFQQIGSDLLDAEYSLRKNEQSLQFANENYDLQNAIAKTFPPSTKGHTVGSALASDLKIGYTIDKLTINYDNAKAIDDYFTMFGYKVNRVKRPSLHNRTRFTYVKTIGCKINGGAPTDVITKMENIMNNGIRFWADHTHVGDYSYATNSVLTP